jgi:hypothetical protein
MIARLGLLFSTFSILTGPLAMAASFDCSVQVVHANTETVDIQPAGGGRERGRVNLSKSQTPGGLEKGSIQFRFDGRPGESSYFVDLNLSLERNRSTWAEKAPRLSVRARLSDQVTGRVLGIYEDHSDKIIREVMVNSLRRDGPRVVYRALNADLVSALHAITDQEVVDARNEDLDEGFLVATKKGLMPKRDVYRFDVVCVTANLD